MKQVAATLRDLALDEKHDVVRHLNREFGPVTKELRRRYNERHGERVAVTAAYSARVQDEWIDVDASAGAVTVTLLPADEATCWVTVRKTDSSGNAVTVSATDLINGATTYATSTQYYAATFATTGETYAVLSEFVP